MVVSEFYDSDNDMYIEIDLENPNIQLTEVVIDTSYNIGNSSTISTQTISDTTPLLDSREFRFHVNNITPSESFNIPSNIGLSEQTTQTLNESLQRILSSRLYQRRGAIWSDEDIDFGSLIDVQMILDPNDLAKLKSKPVTKKYLTETCSICINNYKKDERYILLKCKHFFHEECIKNWLTEYSYKCPMCQYVIGNGVRKC